MAPIPVAAAGFLNEFKSRLIPTLMFSALPPIMQVAENPDILQSDEGRGQLAAMTGASLLAGVIGAGAGTGLNALGNKIKPGRMVTQLKPEVDNAYRVINDAAKTDLMPGAGAKAVASAYKTGSKGLQGEKLKSLDEAMGVLKNTKGLKDHFIRERAPSGLGQGLGTAGDVLGGMVSWGPIYAALSGTPAELGTPETQITPELYSEALMAQGYGSQEETINQQLITRLLQGDNLPVGSYAPGTMFNNYGIGSNGYDSYDSV